MKWEYRPGTAPEQQLKEMSDTLGIQNMRDVSFEESTGVLTIFTDTKKFQVTLTEV